MKFYMVFFLAWLTLSIPAYTFLFPTMVITDSLSVLGWIFVIGVKNMMAHFIAKWAVSEN